ncbi:MAG: hypothetical protein K1X89_30925, partial [Myxococcaceae bacterium]|nr:hypothetical protein [Myxococcaceae bacterium]
MRRRHPRGSVATLVAVSIFAVGLLAMGAVALGRVAVARADAQRVADSASLAAVEAMRERG